MARVRVIGRQEVATGFAAVLITCVGLSERVVQLGSWRLQQTVSEQALDPEFNQLPSYVLLLLLEVK